MPSMLHEGLVELFRSNQGLAPGLLTSLFGINIPQHTAIQTEDAQLTQRVPTEYRADLVLMLTDGEKPVFAIIVEVQLSMAQRKRYAWPLYLTALRARFECPVAVLVAAPNQTVAHWASQPIPLGPGSVVVPIVLGPDAIPRITDPKAAEASPHLAILSALVYGQRPDGLQVVRAALAGLIQLRDEAQTMYYDMMYISQCSGAVILAYLRSRFWCLVAARRRRLSGHKQLKRGEADAASRRQKRP